MIFKGNKETTWERAGAGEKRQKIISHGWFSGRATWPSSGIRKNASVVHVLLKMERIRQDQKESGL